MPKDKVKSVESDFIGDLLKRVRGGISKEKDSKGRPIGRGGRDRERAIDRQVAEGNARRRRNQSTDSDN